MQHRTHRTGCNSARYTTTTHGIDRDRRPKNMEETTPFRFRAALSRTAAVAMQCESGDTTNVVVVQINDTFVASKTLIEDILEVTCMELT